MDRADKIAAEVWSKLSAFGDDKEYDLQVIAAAVREAVAAERELLKEAAQALAMLWPLAFDAMPRRGHLGGCGPEAGCDSICTEVATRAETLRCVDLLRKKIAAQIRAGAEREVQQ